MGLIEVGIAGGERLGSVIEAIRAIVAETGSMPAERVVAERLQVKRHTLRRALVTLRARGELLPARAGRRPAIETRFGEGLASGTNPIEIIELRTIIEPALARFAAMRASPQEMGRIERAATTASDIDPGAADLAFHKAVASGARNTLAAEFYALLRHVATDTRLRIDGADASRQCPKRTAQRDAEHAAIAAAIVRRDPDAAETAMRDHLGAVHQQVLRRLGQGLQRA